MPGTDPVIITASDGIGDIRLTGDGRLSAGTLLLSDLMVLLPALGDLKIGSMEFTVTERDQRVGRRPTWRPKAMHCRSTCRSRRCRRSAIASSRPAWTSSSPGRFRPTCVCPIWPPGADSGGKMQVDRLTLNWGPLKIEATGTVTPGCHPAAAADLTAKVRGLRRRWTRWWPPAWWKARKPA